MVCFLLSFFIAVESFAGISGRVVDEDHNPIAGVLVQIAQTDTFAFTDSSGFFEFQFDEIVPLTEYTLEPFSKPFFDVTGRK